MLLAKFSFDEPSNDEGGGEGSRNSRREIRFPRENWLNSTTRWLEEGEESFIEGWWQPVAVAVVLSHCTEYGGTYMEAGGLKRV